jgi:penicillin-binding protein 1C
MRITEGPPKGGHYRRLIRTHPRKTAAAFAAAGCTALLLWLRLGPIPADLLDDRESASTVVVDRAGIPLYEALSAEGTRSVKLTAAELPPALVAATVAAEDRRFWSHPGVDPIAMLRALKRNLEEREVVEGGSTLTQQTAKLLLNRRSPQRRRGVAAKVYEAVLALRLEHRLTKREVLALYLNVAAYGNQVVGAERASRQYFGRGASMLTPAQAAFLAGLPQRPSRFNPYRSRAAALARQRVVLRRMTAAGALTAEQAREAGDERLELTRASARFSAPHFVEMALASAGDDRPPVIATTLDAGLQADVTGIVESHREVLKKHGASNVAVVVLDNATGEWRAWEGSGDYFDAQHGGAINGPLMPRQPGSALKPFTYALGFENGYSPATVLPDVPSHFPTAQPGVLYSPRNYDGRYRGPLLVRRALAGSENVPAVALASELGVPTLLRFLLRAGFTTFDRNASYYGLGMTLGNAEVRLDELVAAYSAFARRGIWMAPTYLPGDRREPERALVSPRAAFWITDILSDPQAREYIFGRGGSLEFPFPVAVKTGTSQSYHDNWTIGYSRHVTVGVWVGNFDRKPLRDSTGVTGAGPIFHGVMLAAEQRAAAASSAGPSPFDPPADAVVSREICALSGMSANAWCPARQREWIATGDDALPCSWHHLLNARGAPPLLEAPGAPPPGAAAQLAPLARRSSRLSRARAAALENSLSSRGPQAPEFELLTVWPAEYRQWADGAQGRQRVERVQAVHEVQSRQRIRTEPLRISNPPDGATYLIDPTLRREFQSVELAAVASTAGPVDWKVDGRPLATASSERQVPWPLAPGRHTITVTDREGRTAASTVVVR